MSAIRDIPYEPSIDRAVGDLFAPDQASSEVPVLLIHGGGWNALAKESIESMASLFTRSGHPVYSINYRLLSQVRWPACWEDCLAAARFILRGGLSAYGVADCRRVLLCGASAGGHLALMTGLSLPAPFVAGIITLAAPTRLDWVAAHTDPTGLHIGFAQRFLGPSYNPKDLLRASPALFSRKVGLPPLFCLHSRNDRLVPLCHSEEIERFWRARGGHVNVTTFDGDGELHGFWMGADRRCLRPEVGAFVQQALMEIPSQPTHAFYP